MKKINETECGLKVKEIFNLIRDDPLKAAKEIDKMADKLKLFATGLREYTERKNSSPYVEKFGVDEKIKINVVRIQQNETEE